MGRKVCRQCGKAVSAKASRCPHCGAVPSKAKRAPMEAAIGAAGCLVPFLLILVLFTLCAGY